MTKLPNCPGCGSVVVIVERNELFCVDCPICGEMVHTAVESYTIKHWNVWVKKRNAPTNKQEGGEL